LLDLTRTWRALFVLIAPDAAGALRNTPSFSDLYGSANNLSALNEV